MIHRVQQVVEAQPTEPLGVALAVHAVNFLASLFGPAPDPPSPPRPSGSPSSGEEDGSEANDDSKDPK